MSPSRICPAMVMVAMLAGVASAQITPGPDSPVFVVNDTGLTASGSSGTVLANLGPTDVAHFLPVFSFSAEKILTDSSVNAVLGDHDGDGDHHEDGFYGGFDAIEVLRVPEPPIEIRTMYSYVYSTTAAFSGVTPGSVFRFIAGGAAGDSVEVVLSEDQIVSALGQTVGFDSVDTDAFTQDEEGNLFLSFQEDEMVNAVLCGDGGIVKIPSTALTYSGTGVVTAVTAASALVILNETDVDAMVVASGYLPKATVDDVSCLAIDANGGLFTGIDGGSHPNLYFSGESMGPAVLSTDSGGSLATTGQGAPLAAPNPNLFHFGLGSMSGGLGALTVLPDTGRPLVIEVVDGELPWPTETWVEYDIGNLTPGNLVALLLKGFPADPGDQPTSVPINNLVYPQLYTIPMNPNGVIILMADFNGIAKLADNITHDISPIVLLGQPFDPGSALFQTPRQLGAPATIYFP